MPRRTSRDPYWLTAKFNSNCAKCKATIKRGARIFYYPSSKSAYGESCGCAETASNDFAAMRFDEESGAF